MRAWVALGLVFVAGTLASSVLAAAKSSACHEPLFNLVARMGLPNVVDPVEFERRVQCMAMAAFVFVLALSHKEPAVGAHVLLVPAALAAQCFYVAGDTCQGSVVPLADGLDRLVLLFARFSIAGAQLPLDAATLVLAWAGTCVWRSRNTVPHRVLAICYLVLAVFYALYMRRIPPSNVLASLGIAHMTSRVGAPPSRDDNADPVSSGLSHTPPPPTAPEESDGDTHDSGLYKVTHDSTVPGAVGALVPFDHGSAHDRALFTITDSDGADVANDSD